MRGGADMLRENPLIPPRLLPGLQNLLCIWSSGNHGVGDLWNERRDWFHHDRNKRLRWGRVEFSLSPLSREMTYRNSAPYAVSSSSRESLCYFDQRITTYTQSSLSIGGWIVTGDLPSRPRSSIHLLINTPPSVCGCVPAWAEKRVSTLPIFSVCHANRNIELSTSAGKMSTDSFFGYDQ